MVIQTEQVKVIEMFVLEVYYPNSEASSLESERERHYIRLADSNIRHLPVRHRGLTEHIKRACYQAGLLWQKAVNYSIVQNPADWGWIRKDGQFVPNWKICDDNIIHVHTAIQVCSNCKKAFCKRCKCKLSGMKCLPFCVCQRKCPNK